MPVHENFLFNSDSPCQFVLFHEDLLLTILIFSARPPVSSRRLRPQELIEIGLHHSVVDFTVFVRLAAHILLDIFIGSNDERGPAVQRLKAVTDLGVQCRKVLFILNTLAVWRGW